MKPQHFTPKTGVSGPVLEFDLPGLQMETAAYAEGPTGCTVIALDELAWDAVLALVPARS